MEAEGGVAKSPVGWSFPSLNRERLKQWDGSTEKREWERVWVAEKIWEDEEEEWVFLFLEKKQKEGYHMW